jgi:hypothetical protein
VGTGGTGPLLYDRDSCTDPFIRIRPIRAFVRLFRGRFEKNLLLIRNSSRRTTCTCPCTCSVSTHSCSSLSLLLIHCYFTVYLGPRES